MHRTINRHHVRKLLEHQPTPAYSAPQPVVQVLSPRGIEYVFLTISLFLGAMGFGGVLLALVNGQFNFEVLAFPAAVLIVVTPVFSWLFLRLKAAELQNPSLRADPSRRRSTQFIQIVSFIVSLFTLIGFVTAFMANIAGHYDVSISQIILNTLAILVISGGILAYYWQDEHRSL